MKQLTRSRGRCPPNRRENAPPARSGVVSSTGDLGRCRCKRSARSFVNQPPDRRRGLPRAPGGRGGRTPRRPRRPIPRRPGCYHRAPIRSTSARDSSLGPAQALPSHRRPFTGPTQAPSSPRRPSVRPAQVPSPPVRPSQALSSPLRPFVHPRRICRRLCDAAGDLLFFGVLRPAGGVWRADGEHGLGRAVAASTPERRRISDGALRAPWRRDLVAVHVGVDPESPAAASRAASGRAGTGRTAERTGSFGRPVTAAAPRPGLSVDRSGGCDPLDGSFGRRAGTVPAGRP